MKYKRASFSTWLHLQRLREDAIGDLADILSHLSGLGLGRRESFPGPKADKLSWENWFIKHSAAENIKELFSAAWEEWASYYKHGIFTAAAMQCEIPHVLVQAKAQRGDTAMVRIYNDNGRIAVMTDAQDERAFIESVSTLLGEYIHQSENHVIIEHWGRYLKEIIPQIIDLSCKYRGYKNNVSERRLLYAGQVFNGEFQFEINDKGEVRLGGQGGDGAVASAEIRSQQE